MKRTASSLTWLSGTRRPVDPSDAVLAVTADYLVNPEIGDQDGYLMLNRGQVIQGCAANGTDLKALLIRDIKAAEPSGIAPRFERRICQGTPGAPCLALDGSIGHVLHAVESGQSPARLTGISLSAGGAQRGAGGEERGSSRSLE